MGNIKNKFKITMLLKSIFLSMVLLLIYSYKREIEIDIVLFIVGMVSVASILLYYVNVKKYVLNQKLKPLYNVDIKSNDLESAKALIHYGRYEIALMKLKLVMKDNPNNKNIKNIIIEVEQHINYGG